MGYRCYVCGNFANQERRISLHKFPQDANLLKKWLKIFNLNERDDVRGIRICTNHFHEDDLVVGVYSKRLRNNVVPFKKKAHPKSIKAEQFESKPLEIKPTFMNELPSVIISDTSENKTVVEQTRNELEGYVSQALSGNSTTELSPNLSSIDCNTDGNKQEDSELYCRLCLCVSQDLNSYKHIFPSQGASSARQENIQRMLQDIIPDLDLSLTHNPGICSDCEARLIASYDFISLCTQNQDTLFNFKSRSVEPFVDIRAAVEAHRPTKKRKTILKENINEGVISESVITDVSNPKSNTQTTIENLEIKVKTDPDIYESANEPFERTRAFSEQSIFFQGYSISTEQANMIQSSYETASSGPVSLEEEAYHDLSAEYTQTKMNNIQSDVFIVQNGSVNVVNVPISANNCSRISIVGARTLYGSESHSDNTARK